MVFICTDFSSVFSVIKSIIKLFLNVFLIQSWMPKISISMSLNGVAWYLSTCVFLYFIYLYISSFLTKYKNTIEPILYCGLATALMIVIRITTLRFGDDFLTWATYCFPIFRSLDFFVGCNIGWIVRNNEERLVSKRRVYYTLLEVFSICVIFLVSYFQSISYVNPVLKMIFTSSIIDLPISCTLVVLFFLHRDAITSTMTNKILVEVGNLSPYLFLIHYTVIAYCRGLLSKIFCINNGLLLVSISFCISILPAYLYKI